MTNVTEATPAADAQQRRPGSRAARAAQPVALHVLRQVAAENGVCIHPQLLRKVDEATGRTDVLDVACKSTRESRCPACARKAQRLRFVQCREGWHREEELPAPAEPDETQLWLIQWRAELEFDKAAAEARGDWAKAADDQAAIDEADKLITAAGLRGRVVRPKGKRVRSTRRRQGAPDLPRRKVVARTIGRTFEGNGGRIYRPSTFLTVTLDSYGRVRDDGSPVDMNSYDYRRAAWDAIHFSALLDRFWQNMRRAEGWNISTSGASSRKRRLAPHAHFAARGSSLRRCCGPVTAATYHQVWWPPTDVTVYGDDDAQPVWERRAVTGGYVDPTTGLPLPTWGDALDLLDQALDEDPAREPEHVVRFGVHVDAQGVLAGTQQADKLVGYVTKYLTKSVAECHRPETPAAVEHQRRLWEQLRITPCSPRCANWLRYGVQPKNARPRMRAGYCKGKTHQLDTLGIGGRRVLVSRDWSGKTLADHRWDQTAWVRKVLAIPDEFTEPGLRQPRRASAGST
jgi:hypothetical protein